MRIVVAMSGGVDSSVAAALLAEQGHDVIGLSMQLYDASESAGGERSFGSCCSIDDLHDARRVAAAINIPHYILNFERQFNEQVVSNFVSEYAAGRTPLPCAHCNSDLKFATLLDRARGLGADAVATGHYARVERTARAAATLLKRGVDAVEGSVVLPLLADAGPARARASSPSAIAPKDAVREYARRRGLPVADKPDSQEICFIPDHDYAAFVTRHSPRRARAGAIVDESGRVLGRHGGIHRFTVGQRKGLGLPSSPTGAPMYVLALTPANQRGRRRAEGVARADDADGVGRELDRRRARRPAPRERRRSAIAISAAPATVRARPATAAPKSSSTRRRSPITPGQAVVFYDGDVVLGGGWIDN